MKNRLAIQDEIMLSKQQVILNCFREIIIYQEEIKQIQDQIKKSLEVIKKNQEILVNAQMILSESYNPNINRTNENASNNDGRSRPNLSFYNFNCSVPNARKLYGINNSNLSLFHILNSKDSFKSTLDYSNEREGNENSEIGTALERENSKLTIEAEKDYSKVTNEAQKNHSKVTNETEKDDSMGETSHDMENDKKSYEDEMNSMIGKT